MTAITEKLKKAVFNNDIDIVEKLWRNAKGNKADAYNTIRYVAARYKMIDLTDLEIDTALAEMNDGVNMEWAS